MINFSTRKIGGIRFIRLGRFSFTFCVSAEFKPVAKQARRKRNDIEKLYLSFERASDSVARLAEFRRYNYANIERLIP